MKSAQLLLILLIPILWYSCEDTAEEPDKTLIDTVFVSDTVVIVKRDTLLKDSVVFRTLDLDSAINAMYSYLPVGFGDRGTVGYQIGGNGWYYTFSNLTDEGRNKSTWPNSMRTLIPGLISPTGSDNDWSNWNKNYEGISHLNLLLVDYSSILENDERGKRLIAEARYVRAFLYFDLVRRFGNIPLITTSFPFNKQSNLNIPASQSEQQIIYAFIDNELSAIAEALPSSTNIQQSSKISRVSKEAIWAFHGRVLLFSKNYSKSAEISKKVIDSGIFSLASDYGDLFRSIGKSGNEIIFELAFDGVFKYHTYESAATPESFGGLAQHNPTQELVDAYEMINGLSIHHPESGYDPQSPYANRDKRFYETILYHDAPYRGSRKMDMRQVRKANGSLAPLGIDASFGSGLSTSTGYYLRKFTRNGASIVPSISNINWIEIRYAEVLLNYAEAQSVSSGPDGSVYSAMNTVRERAGLPNLDAGLTTNQMMDRIEHERLVELAWENHRYWDLNRWRKAVEVLNDKEFTGMHPIVTNADSEEVVYETFILKHAPKQVFQEKHYLFPIPQEILDSNPQMTQNPGY